MPFDALVEEIDIGGPSLVRAAAKNFRGVLVVVDPADYSRLVEAIDRARSSASVSISRGRRSLIPRLMTRRSPQTLETVVLRGDRIERKPTGGTCGLPASDSVEDPGFARWRKPSPNGCLVHRWVRVGELPSDSGPPTSCRARNCRTRRDLDAAVRIVLEFDEPAAVVIKHTNPCGAATGDAAVDAYVRARDFDSLAAYGGVVGLNRPLDSRPGQPSCRRSSRPWSLPRLNPRPGKSGAKDQHAGRDR